MKHPAWQVSTVAVAVALNGAALSGTSGYAQAPLPATAPTAITPSQLPSANPPAPQGQADVSWDGHLLRITANGESLSAVLAAVAARTNTHLSGNVPADPIYGTYGPAPIVAVLADLLNGLPLNMLFVHSVGNKPAELTLTARSGGVTPPSAEAQQQQFAPPPPQAQQPPPYTPLRQPYLPQASAGVQPTNPPAQPTAAPGANSPTDSGNPASPNGVKTPQEIFEQLQRLRNSANGSGSNPQ